MSDSYTNDRHESDTLRDIHENGQYTTSGAFSESKFEGLQNSPLITINDFEPMGVMSEYDYYVSFTVHCGTFGGDDGE